MRRYALYRVPILVVYVLLTLYSDAAHKETVAFPNHTVTDFDFFLNTPDFTKSAWLRRRQKCPGHQFNSVYLYSPFSQITNLSQSALQSVRIDIPVPEPHVGSVIRSSTATRSAQTSRWPSSGSGTRRGLGSATQRWKNPEIREQRPDQRGGERRETNGSDGEEEIEGGME